MLRPGEVEATVPTTAPDTQLQIIAHPDDDLYFFNPAIVQAIQSGHPVVNMCLTTGEADGRNGPDDTHVDYAGYAGARRTGLRRAYADMALGDTEAEWRIQALEMKSGPDVELNTLADAPHVHLVFFSLWVDSSKMTGSRRRRLADLWRFKSDTQMVLTAVDSTLSDTEPYTRESLVGNIAELLDVFQPTMVRTLDPDPDQQVHNKANPQGADQKGLSDHIDHTASALFAWEALQRWSSELPEDRLPQIQAYRGYYNRRWPRNLGPDEQLLKGRYLDVFSTLSGDDCGDFAGCGDKHVYTEGTGGEFGASTTMRYPGGTDWLRANADGRLSAFVVGGFRAQRFDETPGEDTWRRVDLDSPPLLPHTCLLPDGDDRVLMFGVETKLATYMGEHYKDHDQIRELTVSEVLGDGPKWERLGNPRGEGSSVSERGMGKPTAVFDAAGNLHVGLRNFSRELAILTRDPDGEWVGWRNRKGGLIQDGVSAVVLESGGVEFYAAHAEGVGRWWQLEDRWRYEVLPMDAPTSPPTALRLPDDRLALFVRSSDADSRARAAILAYLADPDGEWDAEPLVLGEPGGAEAVAALAPAEWDGQVALAVRDASGGISTAIWDPASGDTPSWTGGGPLAANLPSLTLDGEGRLAVAAMGVDGKLYIARQPEPGLAPPADWTAVTQRS